MDPFVILLIGMALVVCGVLVFKLHAFLALMLGAVAVGVLTPRAAIERHAYEQTLEKTKSEVEAKKAAAKAGSEPLGTRLAQGFGRTAASIGILIAMASIIGRCLLDSGAADRIVRSTLRLLGEGRAAAAFLMSGFLLGIPVFFDTLFLLMVPLARAAFRRTGKNYILFVLAIVAGGTMTHSLVPPTPGPLFVANEFGVPLGIMILGGLAVGAVTSLAGFLFAAWTNARREIVPQFTIEESQDRAETSLPPLWLSLAPILLPVILISADSVMEQAVKESLRQEIQATVEADVKAADLKEVERRVNAAYRVELQESPMLHALSVLGDKNLAISLAAVVGLLLLVRSGGTRVSRSVQEALAEAGVIILITSAGGTFGSLLQQTGIGLRIRELSQIWNIDILLLAFLVTVLVRTAQGSATVAMITAAGIFAGAADPITLGCHPLYLALAVGCGSKPFAWMNDSGFWVICKTSGLSEKEGLQTVTPMSAIMGFTGIAVILVGARLFPLV